MSTEAVSNNGIKSCNWPLLFAGPCLLLVSLCYGFYFLFSTFSQYDDEGFWLISTRLFQQGHVLYEQIFIPYGPLSIAAKQVLHEVFAVPLSNSAIRFISLGYWFLLGALCGLTVYRLTDSAAWAAVGYVMVFAMMRAFANEPGHPQEIIAVLAALIPLILSGPWRRTALLPWFVIGGLTALIAACKINIGIYCLAAMLVVLVSELRDSRLRTLLQVTAVFASAIFPVLLMWPHIRQADCLPYALICAAALSAAAIGLCSRREAGMQKLRVCLFFFGGAIAAVLLTLAWLWANNTTLAAMTDSIFYFAGGLQHAYFFRQYSPLQVALALAAPLVATILAILNAGRGREIVMVTAKALFAALTVFALIAHSQANAHYLLGWAGPWSWLVALPDGQRPFPVARKALALLAVWHLLLAYPIPGSQLYLGTFLVIVSAVVCLSDVGNWLTRNVLADSRLRAVFAAIPAVSALLALAVLIVKTVNLQQAYTKLTPLDLPGTRLLRLQPARVEFYQSVVQEMRGADVGFVTSGFNSLYFWSGVAMPAPVVVQHDLRLSTEQHRRAVIQGLATAANPRVLMRLPAYGITPAKTELSDWIMSEFEIYRRFPGYALMRRK